MTAFRKYLLCLLAVMLPVIAFAKPIVAPSIILDKAPKTLVTTGNIHDLAFLQPNAIPTITAISKASPHFTAKCADNFIIPLREIVVKTTFSAPYIPHHCRASNIVFGYFFLFIFFGDLSFEFIPGIN